MRRKADALIVCDETRCAKVSNITVFTVGDAISAYKLLIREFYDGDIPIQAFESDSEDMICLGFDREELREIFNETWDEMDSGESQT